MKHIVPLVAEFTSGGGPQAHVFEPEMEGRKIGDVVVGVECTADINYGRGTKWNDDIRLVGRSDQARRPRDKGG